MWVLRVKTSSLLEQKEFLTSEPSLQPQGSGIQCGNRKFLPYLEFPFRFLRDLDARAKNECYRATFRLPKDERLDGHTGCTLWTPFNKLHIPGQMFISYNYICFASKEEDACRLIIPLREVSISALAALAAEL